MDFIIKDANIDPIAVVDLYTSAIWTERYCDIGEFELYLPLNNSYLEYLEIGNYVTLQDSDRAMILESLQIESKIDTGEKLALFKGSSLESILKRRIVWGQVNLNDKVENVIRTLLNDNAISPPAAQAKRRIPNLIFGGAADATTTDYLATLPNVECQFTGEVLFDVIKSLCEKFNLGFKITFDSANKFLFQIYYGTNRSSGTLDSSPIVFSPEYDTLISSRYLSDTSNYKNLALVLGEEKENTQREQVVAYYGDEEPSGLDRRELYVNGNDIRKEEDGASLSDADYRKVLQYRGFAELQENYITTAFDGEVETHIGPQYNRDYFLGDFVSTMNEFGLGSVAQITEYVRSYDASGYSAYPTFVMMN